MRLPALIVLVILLTACPKNSEPDGSSPYSLLNALAKAETFDQALLCYSNNTKKAVREILTLKNVSKSELFPILAFLKGALKWEIRGEKITAGQAELEVLISGHVIDNMTGFVMPCRMLQENDKWRLDIEENILSIKRDGRNGGDYLDKKLQKYQ
ncbi:MAG: hypothetical protein FWG92_01045 [Leptospirales bacterium]|nr:hypothetical protein [Leptospirales bacterium]